MSQVQDQTSSRTTHCTVSVPQKLALQELFVRGFLPIPQTENLKSVIFSSEPEQEEKYTLQFCILLEKQMKFAVEKQTGFFVENCLIMKAWKLQSVWWSLSMARMQTSQQNNSYICSSRLNRARAWVKQGSSTPLFTNNYGNVSWTSGVF